MNGLVDGAGTTAGEMPQIKAAFAAQRETAIALRTSTAAMRIEKLRRLEDAVLAQRADIYRALAADLHKSEAEADIFDVLQVISAIRHSRRHLTSWMKPERALPTMTMFGTKARIHYEPRGVALIIAPWNFPISLLLGPLASAIAAGCPCILKPSEMSPACSALMANMIGEIFEPQDIAVFEGDASVSTSLLELPFDHIFFTGSPAIGKVVMAAAARNLSSVTLELGGKSPVIVDESADLTKAARSIAWGKFSNCGQSCIAPDYAYVHESRHLQFIAAMKDAISSMYGEPAQSPDYCRIINGTHFARISQLIDGAVEQGATILAGGERDEEQNFIAPTVLTGANENAAIMQEEIFGPVLPVLSYRDLAEPIAAVNARPKPLALYVYTNDRARLDRILQETSAGGSCVNATMMQFGHENLPFGGIGTSGLGNAHGFYGFRAFSHERAVVEDKFSVVPMLFPPYSKRVKQLNKWIVRYLA
ncbi:MAG: aldehyde dehydrogenase family protein [Beijerinckiaceae bacterium]|nr:aldehyde dehydrogenase family protein [Beijerinckiaceae bacterium]